MKTYYEVRLVFYQYNSGRGDNGLKYDKDKFDSLEEAQVRYNELKTMLNNNVSTSELASEYVWDGCLKHVEGIYEVKERKL